MADYIIVEYNREQRWCYRENRYIEEIMFPEVRGIYGEPVCVWKITIKDREVKTCIDRNFDMLVLKI